MKSETIKHKIKVFISSRCDSQGQFKYTPIRKNLKYLLEETGMIEAYCFEDEPSTSVSLPNDYISELDDSHLLVLLVDNKDNISDATLKEYHYAKSKKIRIIALFCNEHSKEKTEIENEIKAENLCHIITVSEFSEMAYKAYCSVMQDFAKVYKQKPNYNLDTSIGSDKSLSVTNSSEIIISKELLNEFESTRKFLYSNIFHIQDSIKAKSLLDEAFTSFLEVVLCLKKFDAKKFEETKTLILSKHDKKLKPIIEKRLECLTNYYLGDLQNANENLQNLLASIDKEKVPNWIKDDIAIDTRNVGYQVNAYDLNNVGQAFLDKRKETIIFPVIDSLLNKLKSQAIKYYKNNNQESPYSTSSFSYENIFNDLASYFCIALFYGSITRINLIRQLLQEILYPIYLNRGDVDIFNELVKFNTLQCDDKQLENILRKNSCLLLNFVDSDKISTAINFLPNEKDKTISKLILLKYFGNYLSDNTFNEMKAWLFVKAKEICKKENGFLEYNSKLSDAIRYNFVRYKNEEFFNLIVELFDINICGKNLACNLLNSLRVDELDKVSQEIIKNKIISIIENEELRKSIQNLDNSIILFCKKTTINFDDLSLSIEKNLTKFYKNSFCLELFDKDRESSIKNIRRFIGDINNRFESQQKGYHVSFVGNPFDTISNIIKYNKVDLNSDEIKEIVQACEKIILSPNQSSAEKCNAFALLIFCTCKFFDKHSWKNLVNKFVKHKQEIFESPQFIIFEKASNSSVEFYFNLFGIITKTFTAKETVSFFANVQNMQNYDIILCLKILSEMLDNLDINSNVSKATRQSTVQLSIAMSDNVESDIQYYAVKCLTSLVNSEYDNLVLQQLSKVFDIGSIAVKRLIIERLNKNPQQNTKIDFILKKAEVDRNYFIRNLVKR